MDYPAHADWTGKLFGLDGNKWYHKTVSKQMIIDIDK